MRRDDLQPRKPIQDTLEDQVPEPNRCRDLVSNGVAQHAIPL